MIFHLWFTFDQNSYTMISREGRKNSYCFRFCFYVHSLFATSLCVLAFTFALNKRTDGYSCVKVTYSKQDAVSLRVVGINSAHLRALYQICLTNKFIDKRFFLLTLLARCLLRRCKGTGTGMWQEEDVSLIAVFSGLNRLSVGRTTRNIFHEWWVLVLAQSWLSMLSKRNIAERRCDLCELLLYRLQEWLYQCCGALS